MAAFRDAHTLDIDKVDGSKESLTLRALHHRDGIHADAYPPA
jgi:hypothetical protein